MDTKGVLREGTEYDSQDLEPLPNTTRTKTIPKHWHPGARNGVQPTFLPDRIVGSPTGWVPRPELGQLSLGGKGSITCGSGIGKGGVKSSLPLSSGLQ